MSEKEIVTDTDSTSLNYNLGFIVGECVNLVTFKAPPHPQEVYKNQFCLK